MSKAAEKKKDEAKYAQKYRTEWELNPEFKGWLCVSDKSKHFAFCKYCKCDIQARLVTIRLHSKTYFIDEQYVGKLQGKHQEMKFDIFYVHVCIKYNY